MTSRRCCNGVNLHATFLAAAIISLPWAANPERGLAATPMSPTPSAATATEAEQQNERIARLIKELGSEDYLVRQFAHEELRRLGPAAFDALASAENDRDIEIVSRARYLMQLIRFDWVRDGDSPRVKEILADYEFADESLRARKLEDVARLPQEIALEPLCRLVRFEQSAVVSKQGALYILQQREKAGPDWREARRKIIEQSLAGSQRPGARWLLTAAKFEYDPRGALDEWQHLVDAEISAVGTYPSDTELEITQALLQQQAAMLYRQSMPDRAKQVVRRIIERAADDAESLGKLVDWLVQQEALDMIDGLARRFEHRLNSSPELLYAVAQVQRTQGKQQAADELAERASNVLGSDALRHFQTAESLKKRGLFDWSEREYRRTVTAAPQESRVTVWARISLAEMLYDIEREYDAAEVLRKLNDLMAADTSVKDIVLETKHDRHVPARMHYYYACHYRKRNELAKMRKHLDEGIVHDATDADILIDLYRDSGISIERRSQIIKMIQEMAERFRAEIVQSSAEEIPYRSTPYNQFAWLVANTEGDFDLAVQYSHKSLEIMPDTASYLDTLAHCYAAKRDFKNAVRYQTRAAELEPHTMQIQRSLKRFQTELEKAGEEPQK
jgi:tetratricopeptide (TPR) repeat protein